MKKVLVILIVGMVLFGACSAQRADAQSANIAQKIIGTWVSTEIAGLTTYEATWVFTNNGTFTVTDKDDKQEYKYAVTDTKFAQRSINGRELVWDISISSDGKTLILTRMNNGNTAFNWLTKK